MTQITYGAPLRIDGPPPLRPMFGLLQAAEAPAAGVRIVVDTSQGAEDLNDLARAQDLSMEAMIAELKAEGILPADAGELRWLNGVEVYPYPIDTGSVFDPCANGSGPGATKGYGTAPERPQFAAMTAYMPITCTSYQVWDQDEFKARSVAAFTAVESAIVAHEFMNGVVFGDQPFLADGEGTFPLAGVATSVPNGLANLEAAIAASYRQGLIHCSPMIVTAFREHFAVDNKTGVIRTINGTVVIPDFGYGQGSRPGGHAAPGTNQEWIYATGPVDIRRSDVFTQPDTVAQALERGTGGASTGRDNTITYRAERYYLVVWDTAVHAAVLVDRCRDGC